MGGDGFRWMVVACGDVSVLLTIVGGSKFKPTIVNLGQIKCNLLLIQAAAN